MHPKRILDWGIRLVLDFKISDEEFSNVLSPVGDRACPCEAKGKSLQSKSCSWLVTGVYTCFYRVVPQDREYLVGQLT